MSNDLSLDEQLFTCSGMDVIGTMAFQFYDVELIQDVGSHKKGEKYDSAVIDYEKSKVFFYNEELQFELQIKATFEEVKS